MKIENSKEIYKAFEKLDNDLQNELIGTIAYNAHKNSIQNVKKNDTSGNIEKKLIYTVQNNEANIISQAPHSVFVHFVAVMK